MKKKIIQFDMDNVLVDFMSGIEQIPAHLKEEYEGRYDEVPGIFALMRPLFGAIEAFEFLSEHYDCYILSTAPWENPTAWSDKLGWVKTYVPKAYKRLTLTHNKQLAIGHYLIDDRTKNGAGEFQGEHIHFGTEAYPDWASVVKFFKTEIAAGNNFIKE